MGHKATYVERHHCCAVLPTGRAFVSSSRCSSQVFHAGHWKVKPRFRKASLFMPLTHFLAIGGNLGTAARVDPCKCSLKRERQFVRCEFRLSIVGPQLIVASASLSHCRCLQHPAVEAFPSSKPYLQGVRVPRHQLYDGQASLPPADNSLYAQLSQCALFKPRQTGRAVILPVLGLAHTLQQSDVAHTDEPPVARRMPGAMCGPAQNGSMRFSSEIEVRVWLG